MGGMFTILKVREDADAADPNGWYEHLRRAPSRTARMPRSCGEGELARGIGLADVDLAEQRGVGGTIERLEPDRRGNLGSTDEPSRHTSSPRAITMELTEARRRQGVT